MKKTFRKITTFIVALALIVTLLPLTAMAAGEDDSTLKSITTNIAGVNVSPSFIPGTLNYSVTLPATYTDSNVILTATANNDSAKVGLTSLVADAVTGSNQKTVDVKNDESKIVKFYVFPVNYPTTDLETYTITIARPKANDCNLSDLSATAGTWSPTPFAPGTTSYTLTLDKAVSTTTLHATANSGNATIQAGETATPTYAAFDNSAGHAVTLSNPGDSKIVKFKVTAQDTTTKEYTVTVTRASYAKINVTIKDDIGSGNAFDGVTVEIFKDAACTPANSAGSGVTASGLYTLGSLLAGDYWVKVTAVPSGYILPTLTPQKVTVAEGETKDISITVAKQGNYTFYGNQLKSIGFTGTGSFTTVFDPNSSKFTIVLDESVTFTTITPVKYDSTATLYIAGKNIASKDLSFKTQGSSTRISIKVVPPKGSTLKSRTYTLTVQRGKSSNTNLTSLTSTALLSPGFSKGTTSYTVTLANTVSSFKITPKVEGYKASYRIYTILSGQTTEKSSSSTISLKPGESKTVIVRVTAQNGTKKDYTIAATRNASHDAYLSSLTAIVGKTVIPLSPVFNKTFGGKYTLQLAEDQATVKLTPTKEDTTASYTITSGTSTASPTITLSPNGQKDITITVTAQDGTTTMKYDIHVQRAVSDDADLTSLGNSCGTLAPTPFNRDVIEYNLSLTYSQATVKLTPVKSNKMATFEMWITFDTTTGKTPGTTVIKTKAASYSLSLTPGQIRYVTIIVTAQNGTSKRYYIWITRAAA